MEPVSGYGIAQASPGWTSDAARLVEELSVRGVGIIESVLSPDEVAEMSNRLDAVYRRQCDEVGGEDVLRQINDEDIVRCPLAYDDAFLSLAQHPSIVETAKAVAGDSLVLMMQNGILNRPDKRQAQASWHRDLNYQHWVADSALAISALVCLEEFNTETGGTVCLPGSHKTGKFPSDDFVRRHEVTIDAPSGSVIFMNAMVFHRTGVNRSARVRRAVNHVIGVPILSQPIDIPAMMRRPPPSDPWLAGYLGYRWNPKRDVREWRLSKLGAT
jgi:ectoine hydroxylase-related dioxygenase (phytanoyl-CoA dioxygenase family)